ncbi:MAG: 4-(cytidine 5'-diphospho)-2-C-methyl-D-erythritol kinase [Thermoguttaceae bacterium]
MGLTVQTPAKLNLFFEVIKKRNDGYHEIETLMCPITIFDTVWFSANSHGNIEFHYKSAFGVKALAEPNSQKIPEDSSNIAVRAVELLRQRAEVRAGASLGLIKRIPSAAGLGGGSSDAAAALLAANIGWGLNWPSNKLARLAAELGSDVPFFLFGGFGVCRGRGEVVDSFDPLGVLHFVVVQPPAGLSTQIVYKECQPAENPSSVMTLRKALKEGKSYDAGTMLFNRLQPIAAKLCPWINRLQREFERVDCLGHQMTGSGSAYYGICRHARHARRLARRLQLLNIGNVFAVRTCR